MPYKRIFLLLLPAGLLLASCSTKKNTVVSRAYHNLTARYNGYYYSNEAIDDGIYKVEKNNKDNFDKVLPVYIYPSQEQAKATFPDFDKAIKKSSVCIQKHAIKDGNGNEIPSAGKWIDNNWINIGIAHFYKREYFSDMEAFEYVVRTYNKSPDKYEAMLWLIRTNNEIGSVSSSEPIISLLKNAKGLPHKVRNEFPIAVADYYMRRGQNTEAAGKLLEATRNKNPLFGISKKRRARYNFIIAQLYEQQGDNNKAVQYYRKTIAMKPPNYDMTFYSRIKVARLMDLKGRGSQRTKKDLLRMTREFKNSDYYDVIFYTLGELEEKDRNTSLALTYYKRSVQTSVSNPNQKALSFLKLGEINFDLTNYEPAEAYYDSAVATLPKDHPSYDRILARKKTLETLVTHIRTISREDSLQRIAQMSEADRTLFIDKLIIRLKEEEERKQRELEAAKNNPGSAPGGLPGGMNMPGFPGQGATFYFYNPNTVALGVADFTKKWGTRKLEDNWRRSNKALTIDEPQSSSGADSLNPAKNPKMSLVKSRDFFLKDLPMSDTARAKSNEKMVKAYYMMGSIYREELNNSKKTILAFEQMNSRFPANKYQLNSYYMLYRLYQEEKNQPKADYYKKKILDEFPDSEFALLIKNPDYAQKLVTEKGVVEGYYAETYETYSRQDYPAAYAKASQGIVKYGKNDYLPRFEFIKAMSLGKLKGADTLERSLKLLVAKYPNSEVTPLSNDILLAIKKQKNPELFKESQKAPVDTFKVSLEEEHFIVVITPDDTRKADGFKTSLGAFNSTYYSEKKFEISSNLLGQINQMIVIKAFANAKEAMNYYDNLMGDPDLFKGALKKEEIELFPILPANLQLLYKKRNVSSYKLFFEDNYKKINSKN